MLKDKSYNANIILDKYFSITKELINYRKENPNSAYAFSICTSWLFYLIPIFNLYGDSAKNVYVKITKEILDILKKVRNMVSNGEYISNKIIRELDSKCADKAFVYDMINEYDILIKKIKKYRLSQICKEEKSDVIDTPKTSAPKQSKIIAKVPIIPREERIKLYEIKKSKNHPYLDEECTLTSDEIEYVFAYADMVLEESTTNIFNIDKIIDILSEDGVDNKNYMLIEIINKLKLNNVNSNVNKVLVKLNDILKKNISKRFERKRKGDSYYE